MSTHSRLRPLLRVGWLLGTLALTGACQDAEPDIDRFCRDLQPGHACTWAGGSEGEGYNGDNHRLETLFSLPQDIFFLEDGTAWVTDFNNFLVRRIHPDGQVESMVGSTTPIFPGDGPLSGIPPMGAAGDEWYLNHPTNILLQPDGQLLLVAWHNHKLLTIDPSDGYVSVVCGAGAGFAGDGEPAADAALFKQLNDATYDDEGNLYIVDQQNERVRRIDASGIIDTIAGDGTQQSTGDGGPAIDAQFSWARGSNPNPSGGIVHHAGKLYISDTEAHVVRVIDLESGTIDLFAGSYEAGDAGEGGPATEARLRAPRDLEIGPDGDLYFVDTDNGKVLAVDLSTNLIRTVVGTGELGREDGEGLPVEEVILHRPFGLGFSPEGDLYVVDSVNGRIVKVAL